MSLRAANVGKARVLINTQMSAFGREARKLLLVLSIPVWTRSFLLDQVVGSGQQRLRDREAERPRGFEVDG
jgi:hypothetical protein